MEQIGSLALIKVGDDQIGRYEIQNAVDPTADRGIWY